MTGSPAIDRANRHMVAQGDASIDENLRKAWKGPMAERTGAQERALKRLRAKARHISADPATADELVSHALEAWWKEMQRRNPSDGPLPNFWFRQVMRNRLLASENAAERHPWVSVETYDDFPGEPVKKQSDGTDEASRPLASAKCDQRELVDSPIVKHAVKLTDQVFADYVSHRRRRDRDSLVETYEQLIGLFLGSTTMGCIVVEQWAARGDPEGKALRQAGQNARAAISEFLQNISQNPSRLLRDAARALDIASQRLDCRSVITATETLAQEAALARSEVAGVQAACREYLSLRDASIGSPGWRTVTNAVLKRHSNLRSSLVAELEEHPELTHEERRAIEHVVYMGKTDRHSPDEGDE